MRLWALPVDSSGVTRSRYGRAMPNNLARLAELGIELPTVVPPLAAYVPAQRSGSMVYVSGQVPMVAGALPQTGKVGASVTPEDAKALARIAALNGLAAVHELVGLDAVTQVVKLVGFVACVPEFTGHPAVINGASELLAEIFGDAGRHA